MGRRNKRSGFGDPEPEIEEAQRGLVEQRVMAPVALGGADESAWTDCDLASLAENRLGDRFDPSELDVTRRAVWSARASTERLWPPSAREFERCFWLLDGDERVGTVALATSTLGSTLVRLSSFYLFPRHRGRGIARLVLDRIRDALGAKGRGLRLETSWTWQRSLRFYMRAGMWVRMWKRDVDLWCQSAAPVPAVEISETTARLAVEIDGEPIVLVRAEREGPRLVSFEDGIRTTEPSDARLAAVAWDAGSTLALALAMRGWPLLESPEHWQRGWHGDAGNPEGLADRIVCWEAWAHTHGWRVETPRIPGLPYSTWAELEAEWAKEQPV